jgi:type IV pilus assembly protein PilW
MSMARRNTTAGCQSGVSLIELMVALTIGLFLVHGAVMVGSQSRHAYRTFEVVARLQETARYAFDVMESDVRMASYWGLAGRPDYIVNRAGPAEQTPLDLAAAEQLIDRCGNNWAIDLDAYVAGWNGPNDYGLACGAYQDDYRAGTDGLIVRRSSEIAPTALAAGRLYIQSSRSQGTIFPKSPACIPGGYLPSASETRDLISTAYYVSGSSVGRPDVPALRRKRLAAGSILEEEVVSGVDDLQVRFGIDTNGDWNADIYVDPQPDPAAYGGRIVAARIWLRVRAEDPDAAFDDDRPYVYADVNSAASNDHFRRIVVSRTFSLPNRRS